MKRNTLLKSTLVGLTLFAVGALADGRSGSSNDEDQSRRKFSAVVTVPDLNTRVSVAYGLDLDQETLKRVKDEQLSEAEYKDLELKARTEGVRLGTIPTLDGRTAAKSTENCFWRPWRWGWGWGGGCGWGWGRPWFGGVGMGWMGGWGCGGGMGCGVWGW